MMNAVMLKQTIYQFGLSLMMTSLKIDDNSAIFSGWFSDAAAVSSSRLTSINQTYDKEPTLFN